MTLKNTPKKLLVFVSNFIIFFVIISFIVTCTFMVFFAFVNLSEEDIRRFAPVVFTNIFVLSALFVITDIIRRHFTVTKPVREIKKSLEKIKKGDFNAKIPVAKIHNRETGFKEIAESINILSDELKGVETLRSDFISNVSHEIKTPLSIIKNYASLLKDENLDYKKKNEYLKIIMQSADNLSNLITNILKLNKLENQQIFPETKKYNLSEQLCECLLDFESIWEEKEIELQSDIDDDIIIKADSGLFKLVWNNLMSNAFKFTEKSGKVSVCAHTNDEYTTVTVSDTGIGMTPHVGEHIFDKFYQGDTSHQRDGNGLGLSLVKRIIDITGCEISVTSTFGEGSSFTVKIPKNN